MITDVHAHASKFDSHFRDEICRQGDLGSAALALEESATALGWDLAAFHVSIDAGDLPRSDDGAFVAERMGWPSTMLEGWRRFKLGRDCPIGTRCGTVAEPFHWSCDDRDSAWFGREFSADHRRVLSYYGRIMCSGVAVPVHRRAGGTAYVSWCSKGRDAREIAARSLGSMFLISHVFIQHAEQLLAARPREGGINPLTNREVECLTWAAHGKSEEAIALLLNRSRDTVHFHLQNAVKKLDANNRTHAVAIACTRGLISLR
jgi:DNA-binding CsgD family transcriptional regulator